MPIVGDLLAGRYRIDGILGAGGMASVYRATDVRLDRSVAVKVLSANLAADATLAQRFEREARALAAAAHPAVVAVFDVEPGDAQTGREPFYVMELCEGGSLAERLAVSGRLGPGELVPTIATVAQGLAELHHRGIVHRDVKPANIVYRDDRPKLADFGLARSEEQDLTTLTADGMTVGTLAYLAPELLAGDAATASSDVYALGVAAFQGLTGRLPRPAASIGDLIETRTLPMPVVSSVSPDLGTGFDSVLGAALAVEPSERPSADAFATDLESALNEGMSAQIVEPAEPPGGTRPFFDAADPMPDTVASLAVTSRRGTPDPPPPPTYDEPWSESESEADLSGTIVHQIPSSRPRRTPAALGRSLRERPGLVVIAGFALIVLALAALSTVLGGATGGPAASLPLVFVASASPPGSPSQPSLSPRPGPGLSPSPLVTPTPDMAAPALAALDEVDRAIAGARGAGGLKGKEANELEHLAADVGTALRAGDFEKARERADALGERVEKVADELDRARRARLRNAVDALIDAIPED